MRFKELIDGEEDWKEIRLSGGIIRYEETEA